MPESLSPMVITRAPLRISLAGAGTGFPSYAARYGGMAIDVTIDRYAYAMVSATTSPGVNVTTSDYEGLLEAYEAEYRDPFLPSTFPILQRFGITSGVSIFLTSEFPPRSGIGTPAGCSLALIWALARLEGQALTRSEAARIADAAQTNRLGLPAGGADVYAQALGGLTSADISDDGVHSEALAITDSVLNELGARLMLFFTGRLQRDLRQTEEIARGAERNRAIVIEGLHEIKNAAIDLRNALVRGELSLVGECLNRTWHATRRLGPDMSDPWIDRWYEIGMKAGASGGKMNGLGAPGMMLLCCEPERQQSVTIALQSAGLQRVGVSLERNGLELLLDQPTAFLRPPTPSFQRGGALRH